MAWDSSSYPRLNLPAAQLQLRAGSGRLGSPEVLDPLRAKWLALTPEEWVRQHFTAFLRTERAYPAALMANEFSICLNGTSRRCDTVVFDRSLHPRVICEYKAPAVALTQRVFDQIARYNIVLEAPFLMVSNGLRHFCCRFRGNSYEFLNDIPDFSSVTED